MIRRHLAPAFRLCLLAPVNLGVGFKLSVGAFLLLDSFDIGLEEDSWILP